MNTTMTTAELSAKLRSWRAAHGYGRHIASQVLGVSKGSLRDWEQQLRVPGPLALFGLFTKMAEHDKEHATTTKPQNEGSDK